MPPLQPVELLLILVVAIPLLGTFFPLGTYLSAPTLANPLGTPADSGRVTTVVLAILYVIVLVLFARRSQVMKDAVLINWPLLLFAAWAMVTCFWAENQIFSFNRTGRMLLAILYGLYIAQNFDKRGILRILCYAVLIGLVGSALVTILYPGLSRVVDTRGAYRGAFFHKNVLGSVSALAMMFGSYALVARVITRARFFLILVLGAVFVVLANSVSADLAFLVAAAFVLVLRAVAPRANRDRLLALMAFGVLAACLVLMAGFLPALFEFAGRDATLTGRTDVWRFANAMIEVKPIWGWGHGVWQGPVFQDYVLEELQWPAPHAHNTWIDFRLQLGIPGFAIGVFIAIVAVKRALGAILTCEGGEYLLWVAVIIFQSIRCTTETLYVDPASIEMVWLTLAFARLANLTRSVNAASGSHRRKAFLSRTRADAGKHGWAV